MGMDTKGVTTVDSALFPSDFPLDVMMHPTTVAGDEGLNVMYALLKTLGGAAIVLPFATKCTSNVSRT